MSFGSLAPDSVVGGHVGGPVTFLHLGLPLYSALGPRARGQINALVWSGLVWPGPAQSRLLTSCVSSPGPQGPGAGNVRDPLSVVGPRA